MKKSLLCRFATFGTALILSTMAAFPAFAANVRGHLDVVSDNTISGWAWDADQPNTALTVEISISSGQGPDANTFVNVSALVPREDLKIALGSADHGFSYPIDWTKIPGETFTVTASALLDGTRIPLIGTYTYTKTAGSQLIADTAVQVSTDGKVVYDPQPVPMSEIPADKIALGPGYRGNSTTVSTTATESPDKTPELKKSTETTQTPVPAKNTTGPSASAAKVEPGAYIGEFTASGYCNCQKCSGGHSKTYSGTVPKANHTIAADLNLYPIGTKLVIEGIVYTVEDKGSGVKDNRLDIFFATHAEALAFGLQKVDVYAAK